MRHSPDSCKHLKYLLPINQRVYFRNAPTQQIQPSLTNRATRLRNILHYLYCSYIFFYFFVLLVLTVFFRLFCCFVIASSMGLCLSGNSEINMMMMMMMMMMMIKYAPHHNATTPNFVIHVKGYGHKCVYPQNWCALGPAPGIENMPVPLKTRVSLIRALPCRI